MLYCRRILILGVLATAAAFAILSYKIPVAGLLLGPLALAILFGAKKKTEHLDTLGSARWVTTEELQSAGMLGGKPGLNLGHIWAPKPRLPAAIKGLFDARVPNSQACEDFLKSIQKRARETALVTLGDICHAIIVAPTGAGKGTGCVIPYLLSNPGSCVVIDPKGENAYLTAEHREKRFGHKVVIIDPFDVITIKSEQEKKLRSRSQPGELSRSLGHLTTES